MSRAVIILVCIVSSFVLWYLTAMEVVATLEIQDPYQDEDWGTTFIEYSINADNIDFVINDADETFVINNVITGQQIVPMNFDALGAIRSLGQIVSVGQDETRIQASDQCVYYNLVTRISENQLNLTSVACSNEL